MLPVFAAVWPWRPPLRCTDHQGSSRRQWLSLLEIPLETCTLKMNICHRFNATLPSLDFWDQLSNKPYLQKARQQHEQRRQQRETNGDAKFVRVMRETGGDWVEPKSNRTSQERIRASSGVAIQDGYISPHLNCKYLYIPCIWRNTNSRSASSRCASKRDIGRGRVSGEGPSYLIHLLTEGSGYISLNIPRKTDDTHKYTLPVKF